MQPRVTLTETSGGICPQLRSLIHSRQHKAKKTSIDRTKYSMHPKAPKSFARHHTLRIACAAQKENANHINERVHRTRADAALGRRPAA